MTMFRDNFTYFWLALKHSVRNSSSFLTRVLLAIALLIMGISFATNSNWYELRTLEAHRAIASQGVWAAAYLCAGLLSLWRLTAPAPRVIPGIIINGFVCLLFTTSSILQWTSGSPMGALGAYAALNAFWITLRTSATDLEQKGT